MHWSGSMCCLRKHKSQNKFKQQSKVTMIIQWSGSVSSSRRWCLVFLHVFNRNITMRQMQRPFSIHLVCCAVYIITQQWTNPYKHKALHSIRFEFKVFGLQTEFKVQLLCECEMTSVWFAKTQIFSDGMHVLRPGRERQREREGRRRRRREKENETLWNEINCWYACASVLVNSGYNYFSLFFLLKWTETQFSLQRAVHTHTVVTLNLCSHIVPIYFFCFILVMRIIIIIISLSLKYRTANIDSDSLRHAVKTTLSSELDKLNCVEKCSEENAIYCTKLKRHQTYTPERH